VSDKIDGFSQMLMRKKILIVNAVQFGYFTNSYYQAMHLKSHLDVCYICYDQNKPRLDDNGIKVIYVRNNNKILRRLSFYRTVILNSRLNDYLTVSYYKSAYILGLFSRAEVKILNVYTGDLNRNALLRKFNNLLVYFNCYFFDRVTVLSENLCKFLQLPPLKTIIVPGGAVVIDKSPKQYDRIHLLYLGTLPKRNIEMTIEGFRLFCEKYSSLISCNYDIIGRGDKKTEEKLRSYIVEAGMQNHVRFNGRVNQCDLIPFFREASIGVCFVPQTTYYDNQPPTKLFEYAFSGLINLATNTAENKLYINSENGELCDDNPYSFFLALERIYQSLDKYNDNIIRDSLSEYHWEKIINERLRPVFVSHSMVNK
jgi:hypothetical protein